MSTSALATVTPWPDPPRTYRRCRSWAAGQHNSPRKGRSTPLLRGMADGPGAMPWETPELPEPLFQERTWIPCEQLAFAVLEAAWVVVTSRETYRNRGARYEALAWFLSTRCTYIYDFETICHTLNWDADWIRAGVCKRMGVTA